MLRRATVLSAFVATVAFAQRAPTSAGDSIAVQDAGSQVFNVRDYGAKGDGRTDDSEAINAAINAARVNGGTVLLSAATYAVGSTVNLTHGHLNFIGSGEHATVLRWMGAANGTVLSMSSLAYSEVKGFQVNCNSTAGIGIDATATNSSGVSIQNIFEHLHVGNCLGTPGYDIHVGSPTNQQVSEVLFHEILLGPAATNGIYQEGTQTVNVSYDGVAGGPGSGANGINIRGGSAFIMRYSAGDSSVAVRLANQILLVNVRYGEWEGGGSANATFLLMEDGPGNGNAGPLVTVEDTRLAWSRPGSTKIIQWGAASGAAGHLKLSGCMFDRFAGAPQIYMKAPMGTAAYLTELDNTYLLTPVVTSGPVRRLFVSSSPDSNGSFGFINMYDNGVAANSSAKAKMRLDRLNTSLSGSILFSTTGAIDGAIGGRTGEQGASLFGLNTTTGNLTDVLSAVPDAQLPYASAPNGISVGATTVSSLPSAPTNRGRLFVVTDSTAISAEGQTCHGGSNNIALAFSNGSVWKCF